MSVAKDALIGRIEAAVACADFVDVSKNGFEASHVRELYEGKKRLSIQSTDAIRVRAAELGALTSELGDRLGSYRSSTSDVVGNGLYALTGSQASPRRPSLEAYAKIVVLAAARVGAQRVAEVVGEWIQGKGVRVSSCVLLKGLLTECEMQPVDGLRIETLSGNGDELPRSLRLLPHEHCGEQFVRRAMVCIDYETAAPGLYDPDVVRGNPSFPSRRPRTVNPELSKVSFESLCRALSLETNHQVDWFINWDDYGDVEAFFLSAGFSSRRKEASNSSTGWVTEEQVRKCLRTHALLEDRRELDLAMARWRKSKSASNPAEQLIELRIALESTLLSDDRGTSEKRHRLATRGAWLIGSTFETRKSHFEMLKEVYDYASSVIHGGSPKVRGGRDLGNCIANAQDLCREVILKLAAIGIPSSEEWSTLILGGGALRADRRRWNR